jgi:hypothetical protein
MLANGSSKLLLLLRVSNFVRGYSQLKTFSKKKMMKPLTFIEKEGSNEQRPFHAHIYYFSALRTYI